MTGSDNFDLLIKNGEVIVPEGPAHLDVGVRAGRITALAAELPAERGDRVIDATGKLVFPGFIDAHTHMGIPIKDTSSADDFKSGSIAAAFGGVTTILDFTVQEPGQSLREAVDVRVKKAEGNSHLDFGIHVNVTDRPIEHLEEIPQLIADGFTSFKVFSTYREAGMMISWREFREVMRVVNQQGGLLMLHAEDNDIVEERTAAHVDAGKQAPICHPRSRPASAEAKAIRDAGKIAAELDAPLFIVHLSSRAGLEAGLTVRRQGATVYLETCPQYLVLTEEKYEQEDGHLYITTPALRTQEDTEALWEALAAGEINSVGTDHCPFTREQKDRHEGVFHLTPNGMPGVETLFPLLYTYGVRAGRITLAQMVDLLATNPARIFGIDERKGSIREGADGDFVIWDPEEESVLSAATLHGNADWSPYEGMKVNGRLAYTILRGQVLVEGESFVGEAVEGRLLQAERHHRPVTEV